MRCEDGGTNLNESFGHKIRRKREDVQSIQLLVPLRYLALNLNVCGFHRSLEVGYRDKDFPLENNIFLDAWDIMSSNN